MRARLTILAALALAALAFAGCGAEFDPYHLANKYRVLTIKAEPPEVVIDPALFTGQGGEPPPPIELTALTSPPPAGTTYRWEACLFSLDSLGAFACASEDLEITLDDDGPTATLDLVQLFLAVAGNVDAPPGGGGAAPPTDCPSPVVLPDGTCVESFRVQLRLTTGPAGEEVVAVRSVGVSLDPNRAPNQNPVITALEVDGPPTRGADVTLRAVIDEASLEQYTDLDGNTATERPVMSWFTTAGELSPGATFDDDRDTTLTLPDDPAIDSVEVYLVVRDGDTRRGIDFATTTLTLQ